MRRGTRSSLETIPLVFSVLGVVLVGVFSPGCIFDSSARGLLEGTGLHDCDATLRSEAGEKLEVSTEDALFGAQSLTQHYTCGIATTEELEEHWRKLIHSVITVDPTLVTQGPWCLGSTECTFLGPVPESPDCHAEVGDETPLEVCRPEEGCLTLTPPPSLVEPTFESLVQFGEAEVGATAGPLAVTISNDACGEEVQITADGAIGGRDPEHFSSSNDCGPDSPMGRALAPGESCELSFTFSPRAHGDLGANSTFARDQEERYAIALRGVGLGGTLTAPDAECLGRLEGWRAECGGNGTAPVEITLTHVDGPPVEIQAIRPGFAFEVDLSTPITVPVGGSVPMNVVWCEPPDGDIDALGSLEIDSNGANGGGSGAISIELVRRADGCL